MAAHKTVLIVDDHALFREGLKTIISRNPAYEVVGETGGARPRSQMAKSLRPDLMLVDISLPDQSGIELVLQLRKKALPKTFIMMVTMHSKVDYIVKAFQAGATGLRDQELRPGTTAAGHRCRPERRILHGFGRLAKGGSKARRRKSRPPVAVTALPATRP